MVSWLCREQADSSSKNFVWIDIVADGFLYNMALRDFGHVDPRRRTQMGCRRRPADPQSGDRRQAGATSPRGGCISSALNIPCELVVKFRVVHFITRLIIGGMQENTLLTVEDQHRLYGDEVTLICGPGLGPEGSPDRARHKRAGSICRSFRSCAAASILHAIGRATANC